jgi:acyl-CoA thioesterase-1
MAPIALWLLAACGGGAPGTNGGGASGDSAATVAAGSGSGENTPEPVSGAVPRVVLLGTSLTAGLGLDPDKAYPALLQQKADSAGYRVRIVNAGLSGETSAGALRRASWVLDQPAALVVLEVGANDGLRGVDPDSTYANLVKLVAAVKSQRPEAQVALMQMEAPTNLGGDYTRRFHDVYGRAAKASGVPLWHFLLDGVAGVARLNQADGIHPNEDGSVRVATTVWTDLAPALAALPR